MKKINTEKENWINRDTDALFDAIGKLKTAEETRMFFRDLLTSNEIIEFAQRWKVAKMLADRISYVKIAKETGMSSTTIARVHKWLKKGTGGYKTVIDRL